MANKKISQFANKPITDSDDKYLLEDINGDFYYITKAQLLATISAGAGTVSLVSVTTANGISGTVATATSTPAISLNVNSAFITGKTTVTAVGTDYVMISDTSDGGNLKKVLVSDFTGAGIYEVIANKDIDSTFAANSDTKYPSQKAVKTAVDLKSNIASPTFTGTVTTPAIIVSSETASTIASFDGSKNIKSLATATYPSLTEISYVKGLTSAVQSQLDSKSDKTVYIQLAASDETTALTTGTSKITFRMPHALTLTSVRASLSTAQTSGSIFTVDINESGSTILSTKLTIDNTEKTSTTAATAPVISDSALADDAEITIDIDQVGDGTAKGLKITLIGTR